MFCCILFLSYLDSLLEQSIIFLWTYDFLPMLQPLCETESVCAHMMECVCACMNVCVRPWVMNGKNVCVREYLKFFFSYFV